MKPNDDDDDDSLKRVNYSPRTTWHPIHTTSIPPPPPPRSPSLPASCTRHPTLQTTRQRNPKSRTRRHGKIPQRRE
ncbi:hypothetical protein LshimejAT787_1301310 [Lyophyllum shimeji]|uniref:Uncharacterized protein n=1 Tax=Lyophyllum shimeji TaxID=47721 RepID=A0A9P3PUM8_LYOSH|nr:hypothetical protein LshimejAT787_1301310 [Lyophyllum shimeji]